MEDRVILFIPVHVRRPGFEDYWRHTWRRIAGDEPDDQHRRMRPTEAVAFDNVREHELRKKK